MAGVALVHCLRLVLCLDGEFPEWVGHRMGGMLGGLSVALDLRATAVLMFICAPVRLIVSMREELFIHGSSPPSPSSAVLTLHWMNSL